MGIKNKVGPPVSGNDFFDRPGEIKKILRALNSDTHIMISSPRRVGKTSILYRLADMDDNDYYFLYVITQSVNSEKEFFKRLSKALMESDSLTSSATRISEGTSKFLKKAIDKIKSIKGVEIKAGWRTNYRERFIKILKSLQLDGSKVVIMVDEFTETVENIIKNESAGKAIQFLQSIRELRHDEKIRNNILFIFTGSIGLENVVARLDSVHLISDLNTVRINPLKKPEAEKLVRALLENLGFEMSDSQITYMLGKIEWLIPFYIQLFIRGINDIREDEGVRSIRKEVIEKAFREMLKHRNHFEHWQKRLKKSFKKKEYRFAEDILNVIAKKSILTSNEIFDLAVKHDIEDDYKNIVHVLSYDGYINNNDNPKNYRFNSPILKAWWYEYITN